MKNRFLKAAAIGAALLMTLTMLSACKSDNKETPAETEPKTTEAVANAVTIDVDGRQITIEDTEGKSLQQLLEQANIVLNAGDVLSVDPEQMLNGTVTVHVLRRATVTITVEGETPQQYTVVLVGGTVADVFAAVGVEPGAEQQVNLPLDKVLEDGLQIVVSAKEEQEEEQEESSTGGNTGGNTGGSTGGNTGGNTGGSTETQPQKTVVSVQYYEDCDGSGHGVKVITYSDGTQEEVPY